MEQAPKPLRKLVVKILLLGVFLLAVRFLYLVVIRGESCDSNTDFCFFSATSPQDSPPIAGTGLSSAATRAFIRGAETTIPRPEWSSREWRNAVAFYSAAFQDLLAEGVLSRASRALCVGTPVGHEVFALKEVVGVPDAVGVARKKAPPLVVAGDLSRLPFDNATFDFLFSGCETIDKSSRLSDFASEITRALNPEGFLVVHTSSAGDLYSLDSFLALFPYFKLIRSRERHNPGSTAVLRELLLQKKEGIQIRCSSTEVVEDNDSTNLMLPGGKFPHKCSIPKHKIEMVSSAEPLIEEEPLKPWITLKKNVKNVKYLPTMVDISFKRRYVYIDVGSRSYVSSIGSWFKKQYPKQNRTFEVYAIEADRAFHSDYAMRKGVKLLPFAAWVRNETLSFEVSGDPDVAKERGMGRIKPVSATSGASASGDDVHSIQGFDLAEWLKNTVSETDFVVMKMDVEGTEFDLIPRLFETGAICMVDELFLECHYNRWQRCCPGVRSPKYEKTYGQCLDLFTSLRASGVLLHQWW